MKVWGHDYQNIGAVNNSRATFWRTTVIKVNVFFYLAGATERPFCILQQSRESPIFCLPCFKNSGLLETKKK